MGPLSNRQKGDICQVARKAYIVTHPNEVQTIIVDQSVRYIVDADLAKEWRHSEQLRACGKTSLTSCTQGDYAPLMAHFYKLMGEDGKALKWMLRANTDGQRVAMHKLEEECQRRGLSLSYPDAILYRRRRKHLVDASEREIWMMVYQVRNSRHPVLTEPKPELEEAPF